MHGTYDSIYLLGILFWLSPSICCLFLRHRAYVSIHSFWIFVCYLLLIFIKNGMYDYMRLLEIFFAFYCCLSSMKDMILGIINIIDILMGFVLLLFKYTTFDFMPYLGYSCLWFFLTSFFYVEILMIFSFRLVSTFSFLALPK